MHDDETPQDEPFTIPLPPPPFGPGAGAHDRFLFVRHASGDAETERQHEDIMLRRVPRETAMRFRAAAGGRGLTHAQYLAALVELHGRLRARADAGDEVAQATLAELGLGTVTV
jgi:hypothetical protein